MSKKNTTKKTGSKKAPSAEAAPARTTMPAPDVLATVTVYDKKDKKWDTCIREGKYEHVVLEERFENDDDAKAAGDAWLAKYTKADEAGRRKMMGWKPAKGGAKIGELADAMTAKAGKGKKADATADGAKAGGKAKREPKPKKGSTRGPSGLDVAAQMLKDAGTPLKCKEMVEQMLAKGLWATNGKTPAATIYAAIIREIAEKGKEARFTKTDRGTFAFSAASGGEKKGA